MRDFWDIMFRSLKPRKVKKEFNFVLELSEKTWWALIRCLINHYVMFPVTLTFDKS